MKKQGKLRKTASAPAIGDLVQQALALQQRGQIPEADALCRRALGLAPANPNLLTLATSLAANLNDWARAGKLATKAARIQPDDAHIQFNLGRVQAQMGAYQPARAAFERALKLNPALAPAAAQLGRLQQDAGAIEAAIAAYRRALDVDPKQAGVQNNLGNLLRGCGQPQAAIAHLRAALELAPTMAEAHANLALALQDLNQLDAAAGAFQQALDQQPDNAAFWQGFCGVVQRLKRAPECDGLRETLLAGLQKPYINHNQLALLAQQLLCRSPERQALLDAADRGALPEPLLADPATTALLQDPLLPALLHNALVRDRGFERLLTALRAALLRQHAGQALDDRLTALAQALAAQCFLNEYLWQETEAETLLVAALEQRLATTGSDALQQQGAAIALLACYRPLAGSAAADALEQLAAATTPADLDTLLREQLREPAEERALRRQIPCLATIADETSQQVRAQYEQNPYPRWKSCHLRAPRPLAAILAQALPHLAPDELPAVSGPEILIAGCGTGLQTMRVATSYADARILAVDLSLASLAYSARKSAQYRIGNVEYLQADILQLGRLERSFDVIESFGVLHHMREPARGLQVLSQLLRPGGVMLLGIYSELARSAVRAARAHVEQCGYPDTAAGIRQCRQDLFALPPDDPAAAVTSPASDFWTLSDTRDLVFHREEHRYTLLQLQEMLDAQGLAFLGFELPGAATRQAFISDYPEPDALRSLVAWHEFETRHPDTFGDTYRFWVRKPA